MQFYFPLWRCYLNNPLFIFNLCSPHPEGECLQSRRTTSLWSAGCKDMPIEISLGGSLTSKPGLLLQRIWGEGPSRRDIGAAPCPEQNPLQFGCKCLGVQKCLGLVCRAHVLVRTSSQLDAPATKPTTESPSGKATLHFGRERAKPSTQKEGITMGDVTAIQVMGLCS